MKFKFKFFKKIKILFFFLPTGVFGVSERHRAHAGSRVQSVVPVPETQRDQEGRCQKSQLSQLTHNPLVSLVTEHREDRQKFEF